MGDLNYRQIRELDANSRKNYLQGISEFLGRDYQVEHLGNKAGRLPSFLHKESEIEFVLIPRGEFLMGLSEEEELTARKILDPPPFEISEMRPTTKKTVRSFLLSTAPMMLGQARRLFEDSRLSPYLASSHFARMEPNPFAPVYVERENAIFMVESLRCRLPHEAEWEYACRANTTTMFPWGDALPPEHELEKWLDFGLPRDKWKCNHFGLYQLFSGDWCMDEWTDSHEKTAAVHRGVFVIRGGGAIFWPWQNSGEWVWCMPARRMPSTGLTADRSCAFRLVKELPGEL